MEVSISSMIRAVFGGWSADQTIQLLAIVGAFVAFIVGLFQYRRAQQWRRAEWVAKEMQDLLSDPYVRSALRMTDWGSRSIELYPQEAETHRRTDFVTTDEVVKALQYHEDREGFSDKEAAIRDAFDRLLEGWEKIESYIEIGLVTPRDVKPYFEYWSYHLRPDSHENRLAQIRRYMNRYQYHGAERLLDRFYSG